MKSKRVKAMLMGEVIKPRINIETDLTDKLRMGNGVAPNLVHSVDSAAMMSTVNIAYKNGITNFCNVKAMIASWLAFRVYLSILLLLSKPTKDLSSFCKVFSIFPLHP